ncbi:putative F-box-like domain protein [Rhizoctonia solani 123E]|uniref:Putative F-box-like domain protein n=1 Tax=Rhizoctonia solani 123E TaxID=1423351 RepID=A0A074SP98_9AGAM|nr:putative F-box-like domain protein [Rhizoctonia solani 123E]
MVDNFKTASNNLRVALEQYLYACNGICTSLQGPEPPLLSGEDTQHINTELASMPSYEEKFREARLNLTRARNRSFSFAPINSLPSNVLACIFSMIVDSQPCILTTVYDEVSINRDHAYPDLLMQVCSHWRQIVELHPSLWVHIDFVPDCGDAKLISKAKTRVKRAQAQSLEVHIVGTEDAKYDYSSLAELLESLAGSMKALELTVTEEDIGKFYSLVLKTLLSKSDPTIFTRFSLRSQREHRDIFITPSKSSAYNHRSENACLSVDLSLEALERTFAALEALDLCSIFPPWNSKAYHGLVELKLTSSMDELYSQIPEQDLITILKASPDLRILHFAMNIVSRQRGTKLNGSVVLNSLEELEISSSYDFQERPALKVDSLLRLLSPGDRPLRLMLQTLDYDSASSWEAIKSFLARSNVTKFHAKSGAPSIDELLRCMPHLTELSFSYCGPISGFTPDALKRAIKDTKTTKYPLIALTMRDCRIYLDRLRLMVELCPTKSLVFYNCNFWENERGKRPMSDTKLSQLLNRFPTIKFIKEENHAFKSDSAPTWDSGSDSDSES